MSNEHTHPPVVSKQDAVDETSTRAVEPQPSDEEIARDRYHGHLPDDPASIIEYGEDCASMGRAAGERKGRAELLDEIFNEAANGPRRYVTYEWLQFYYGAELSRARLRAAEEGSDG